MTARVVLSGHVAGAPMPRTSKTGKRYVIVSIREAGSGRLWSAFAFRGSVAEAIERLAVGEPIEISGMFYDASIFDGRVNLRIRVDAIIKPSSRMAEAEDGGRQITMAFDSAPAESPSRLAAIARGFRTFFRGVR